MKKILFLVLMIAMALVICNVFLEHWVAYGATTRSFTLYGSISGGWGFTPASMSGSPGPTIIVEQGDTVNLTLISDDGITHRFFVSYSNATTPKAGDPMSSDFATSTNFQFAATSTIGTYTYYCYYHTAAMWGYFQVVQSGTIPEFQPMMMLSLLAAITVVTATVYRRKSHF